MKSRMSILTRRGLSFRVRRSMAVTMGYFWNSSDMSCWKISERCCQLLSDWGRFVPEPPRLRAT